MAMREDCKYFQRRLSASGEPTRFCALDLAPEAPWRCPAECPRYTRLAGLRNPAPASSEPADDAGLHPDAVALLGSADEIIGALGPELEAERKRAQEEERRRSETWWSRLKGRSERWRR
ncbi:MAG: hypothetical protein M0T80_11890 [Actinomycetota bacterium]|nr:hypothetical protein [Actinomycetota bacterium]